MQLQLLCEESSLQPRLEQIAAEWHLTHDEQSVFALMLTAERLELRKLDEPKWGRSMLI